MLPVPRQRGRDGKVTEVLPFDYRLAQMFDSLGTLEEYMDQLLLELPECKRANRIRHVLAGVQCWAR